MTPFWSRPLAPILLGIGGCVACCAIPLTAIVLGAGAAGSLAFILEPLAGILIAAAVLLGGVIYLRRRRARAAARCATTGACAADQRCGCGPSAKISERPNVASSPSA